MRQLQYFADVCTDEHANERSMCCSNAFMLCYQICASMHDGDRLCIYQTTASSPPQPLLLIVFIVLLATGRRLLSYVCFGPCRCMISRHPAQPSVTPTAQLHFTTAKQIKCMCKRRRVQVRVCHMPCSYIHACNLPRSSAISTSRARFVPE